MYVGDSIMTIFIKVIRNTFILIKYQPAKAWNVFVSLRIVLNCVLCVKNLYNIYRERFPIDT